MDKLLYKCHCIDCIDFMHDVLPEECIDLAFTSPPYESQRTYEGTFEGKVGSIYAAWMSDVARGVSRVLKPKGVFGLNVHYQGLQNGTVSIGIYETVVNIVHDTNLKFIGTIIWAKTSGIPAEPSNRPNNRFEHIFIFARDPKPTFNGDKLRTPYQDSTIKRREYKVRSISKHGDNHENVDSYMKDWNKNKDGAFPTNVIILPQKTGEWSHPAPMNMTLAEWIILMYSNPGDIVYDPFCGSGTTLEAALKHNRKCLGSDTIEKYCNQSNERASKERSQKKLDL